MWLETKKNILCKKKTHKKYISQRVKLFYKEIKKKSLKMLLIPFITYTMITETLSLSADQVLISDTHPLG